MAKSTPVKIVVTDLQLPDIDGISIIDRLAERQLTVCVAEIQRREQHVTADVGSGRPGNVRLVKPNTAGAILGQVKADRAAKLTEQLLAQSRNK